MENSGERKINVFSFCAAICVSENCACLKTEWIETIVRMKKHFMFPWLLLFLLWMIYIVFLIILINLNIMQILGCQCLMLH